MKRIKGLLAGLVIVAISIISSNPLKASCDAPFTGEWIICLQDLPQFLADMATNCDGQIEAVDMILIVCDEEESPK